MAQPLPPSDDGHGAAGTVARAEPARPRLHSRRLGPLLALLLLLLAALPRAARAARSEVHLEAEPQRAAAAAEALRWPQERRDLLGFSPLGPRRPFSGGTSVSVGGKSRKSVSGSVWRPRGLEPGPAWEALALRGPATNCGKRCAGSLVTKTGNCSHEKVMRLDGEVELVQLYCYRTLSKSRPEEKAGLGQPGTCLVPRRKPCNADAQCRTGTYCLTDGEGQGYACMDVTRGATSGEGSVPTPEGVTQMVLFVVEQLVFSLSKCLASGCAIEESGLMDPRSGALSPFSANPRMAIGLLSNLHSSFSQSSEPMGETDASRSGAVFVVSGDRRFLVKRIREEEFNSLAHGLVAKLSVACGLRAVQCDAQTLSRCWAEAALNCTLLNMPLLAFMSKADKEHWVILPASSQLRGFIASGSDREVEPWGKAEYFDVKPAWAKSNARPHFLSLLSGMELNPMDQRSPPEQELQWEALMVAVESAVDLLTPEQGSEQTLIDYSLLFEVYRPGRPLPRPGRGCLASRACFLELEGTPGTLGMAALALVAGRQCRVICVSIIDYFTLYTPLRYLESLYKDNKFHNYGQKVLELLRCSFGQRIQMLFHVKARNDEKGQYELVADPANLPNALGPDGCGTYLEMACRDALETLQLSDNEKECRFLLYWSRIVFCSSWMAMKCRELLFERHAMRNWQEARMATSMMLPR